MVSDRKLILIVDDSPPDALLLSRSLAKSGYKTMTAHSGGDALRIVAEKQPGMILLDMMMPGMDGIATCRALKANPATAPIPIIFVTASSDSEHIAGAFSAGAADYVTKPICIDEILARLSVQLRLREAEQNLVDRNRELEAFASKLADMNEALARQSRIDGLTNLLNRGAWDEAAQVEHERALRYGHPYSILMLDVDYFKPFNDTLGHPEGDRCLQQIADVIARACRTGDLAGRYGGEEFVVLLTETPPSAGMRLAERIRQGIWNLSIRHPTSPAGRVTVSIGVAGSQEGTFDEALRCADTFLYRAKTGGRNLVCSRQVMPLEPQWSKDAKESPSEKQSLHTPGQFPSTILVVDDDQSARALYREILEKEAYRIIEAENGTAAIEAASLNRPDLVLMDLMMPVMDGIECTRHLKADPEHRDIPVIIVSARDDSNSVLAGLDVGAEDYLTKPVRPTELLARVRTMIRLTAERRDLIRSYQLRAEQIRFLTVLVDFCRTIGHATTTEDVLECVISATSELTCCRRISVLVPDASRAWLTLARSMGIHEQQASGMKIPIGEGIPGQVIASHQMVLVNEPDDPDEQDTKFAMDSLLSPPALAVPLEMSGEILGVLCIADRVDPRPFENRELEYIELVAGIAASALYTMRNRQARDEARDLVVNALARLAEHRDSDTGRHVERVTEYSRMIAESLRRTGRFTNIINDSYIRNLFRAVPLHDIGKVAIPDNILLKPGKLTLDEMAVMRTHVNIGAETLRPLIARVPEADSLRMALDIIRAHHEWYDGSGYPQGLKGEQIPLSARIVAIADVYDALTRDRVYKEAISVDEAERIILQAAGTQFDPVIVEAFNNAREEFRSLALQLADVQADQHRPVRTDPPVPVETA